MSRGPAISREELEQREAARRAAVARRQGERKAARRSASRRASAAASRRQEERAARSAAGMHARKPRPRVGALKRRTRKLEDIAELLAVLSVLPDDQVAALPEDDQLLAIAYLRLLGLHDQGLNWRRIAAALNAAGLRNRSGARWGPESVAREVRELLGSDTLSGYQLRRQRRVDSDRNTGRRRREIREVRKARAKETAARDRRPRAGAVEMPLLPREELPPEITGYLRWRATFRSSATVSSDEHALRRLAAFMGPDGFLEKLDDELLARYLRVLPSVQPHPATRAGELSALRAFLRHAYDESWTARDLSRRITLPNVPEGEPRPIPARLVPGLLAALPRDNPHALQIRALVHFMISTGCRISEGLSVDRSDLTAADDIRVRGAKGSGMRTVLLLPAARAAVDEYLEARGADDCPGLFVAHLDRPAAWQRMTSQQARVCLRELRRRLPDNPAMAYFTSWHVTRHTLATVLLEVTHDARLVEEVLGHRSSRMLRIYTQISDPRKRQAYAPGSAFAGLLARTGP
jgi:site-specific recombinase XerD